MFEKKWNENFEKQKLRLTFKLKRESMIFLENSILKVKGINDITIETKEHWIKIKDYEIEHNFSHVPYELLTFIDVFFKNNIEKFTLDKEQEVILNKTIKFLSRFKLRNVCVPFFYCMRYGKFGLEKAKKEYRPERNVKLEQFIEHVVEKAMATTLSRTMNFKNRDKILY